MSRAKRSRIRARNNPRNIAVHEAGHAVIARVLTLLCGSDTIKPDYEAGEAGHAVIHDPLECQGEWYRRCKMRSSDTVYRARIISSMAGAVAEAELLGASEGGDGYDLRQIDLMAEQIFSPTAIWTACAG